jgi:hypothetical protein
VAQYQYKCSGCRFIFTTESRTDIPDCPVCHKPAKRDFVFNLQPSNPEHFSHTVGGYVSNDYELKEAMKRMSDEQSERVGMEHKYEYLTRAEVVDPTAHGVTTEGLDTTERAWAEQ